MSVRVEIRLLPPLLLALAGPVRPAHAEAEPPLYGTLEVKGSGSLTPLLAAWAQRFARRHPGVRIHLEGRGSATAPPALIAGTAEIGPMSRPMRPAERRAFERRHGVPPLELTVALDAVAVFVHRQNPLPCLRLAELPAYFAHPDHAPAEVHTRWPNGRSLTRYGPSSASGTHAFFKQVALGGSDFHPALQELAGSGAVAHAIAHDPRGIGFASLAYQITELRAVPLAAAPGARCLDPSNPLYPLRRPVFLYVSRSAGRSLPAVLRRFLAYLLSRDGQAVAARRGYVPLPEALRQAQRRRLEAVP